MDKNINETDKYIVLSSDRQGGYIVKMKDGSGVAFVDKNGVIGANRYAAASIIKQHPTNIIERIKFGFKDYRYVYSVRRIDGKGRAWVTNKGKIVAEKGTYNSWTADLINKLNPNNYQERFMIQTLENEVYYQLKVDAYEHSLDSEQDDLAKRIKETLKALEEFKNKVEKTKTLKISINKSIENIKQNTDATVAEKYAQESKTYAEKVNQPEDGNEPAND